MVVLGVLGPVELRAPDGSPVRLGSTRQRRLLAALALRSDRPVAVDLLAELVWDDDLPADPPAAVQTNVARLRRRLPAGLRIDTEPAGYRLRADPGALDVDAFTQLLDRAAATADPRRRLTHLDAALALWRGRPYDELDHPDVTTEQTRLDELRSNAVEARADALLDAGRPDDAIAALDAHVAAQPLRERPVATLVRALAATGRQAEALRAYGRLRTTLRDELGLDPSPELQALEAAVLRQELPPPAAAPAAPSGVATGAPGQPPARVPLPVSSFVGRDADLAAVAGLLERCRVVTLCGPGGVGKSRLALHAAAAVADRYPDGVVAVELGTLTTDAGVAPAVAAALRVTGRAGEPLDERLAEVLAVRRLLLVLDDCEHVADAAAPLVERLVQAAPGLDVLASSRAPLRVDGEHVHLVHPLGPDDTAALLADRAAAAAGGVDPGELGAVAARLDGLPLAVELAAARLPALGGAGLAAALDEPFDVLTGGRRGSRHRSLLDVVEWSYRSLDDGQRELFDRLSVFAGAVDAAAVQEVCGSSAAALADLVERSLVTVEPGPAPRYAMLDTLRTYGRRQLARDGAGERLRDAQAAWAGRVGTELLAAADTPDAVAAVRRFDALLPDLRTGFERLVRTRRLDELGDLGLLLGIHAFHRLRDDLVRLLDDAVTTLEGEQHPAVVRLLAWSAQARWQRGDLEEAQRRAERGIAVADALGLPAAARDCHNALSNVALFRADLDTAEAEIEQAVALADADPDGRTALAVFTRIDQALLATYREDHERAGRIAGELQATADATGSPTWKAWTDYVRGEDLAERDPAAAAPYLERAIAHAEEIDAAFVAGVARHTLLTSRVRVAAGAGTLADFDPVLDHWHRTGAWVQLWVAIRALVERLSADGRHDDVVRLVAASEASARAAPPFGPDAERLARASARAVEALGDGVEAFAAEGRAMGDEGAIALARRLTRG